MELSVVRVGASHGETGVRDRACLSAQVWENSRIGDFALKGRRPANIHAGTRKSGGKGTILF